MATTVGQHSVAAFTSPVNGTTPIDANSVRGNDNTVRSAYVDHDADPGIHVQSSTLASRPAAGTAGRKWITEDSGVYTLWFDDGTNWHPVSSENINLTVLATETLVKGDVVKVTGWNNGQDLPEVAKVSSTSDTAFAIITANVANGAMGYATNTGIVQDLATNGFSFGATLYPNTSGGFTATKPTSGTYQPCAYVLRSNANNGVLYVEFSAPRIVESSSNTASTVVQRDASGNFSAGTITAGALTASGAVSAGSVTSTGLVTFASLKGTGATTVTDILNDSTMATASATTLATSASIKTYVDNKVATVDTLAEVLANGNTTGANDIIVNAGQKIRTPLVAAQDGTSAITIANSTGALTLNTALADSNLATISTAGKVANSATTATSANTASAIVARDASGNFSAGTITATLSGAAPAGSLSGTTLASNVVSSSLTSVGTLTSLTVNGDITASTNQLKLVASTGNLGIGTATPAYKLDVAGSANVSTGNTYKVNGTDVLSATTLGSGVTASSLTSVGTLTSLTVSGAITGATSTNTINGLVINSGGLGGATGIKFGIGAAFSSGQAEAYTTSTTPMGIGTVGAQPLRFYTNSALVAAFDSSGNLAVDTNTLYVDAANNRVGVGTASPSATLDVNGGNIRTSSGSGTTFVQIDDSSTGGRTYTLISAGAGNAHSVAAGSFYLRDSSSGATRLLVDPSGNLGLGVTPSAWLSAYKVFQNQGGSFASSATSNVQVTQNAYLNASTQWIYTNSTYASQYSQTLGQHQWYTAASGTAGTAITFTQAMTLDASGNLGLGTTSPAGAFEIVRNSSSGAGTAYPSIRLDNQNASGYTGLYFLNSGTSKAFFELKNDVGALTMGTGTTERARITSGGDVGIAVTNPAARLDVSAGATGALVTVANEASTALKLRATSASLAGTLLDIDTTRAADSAFKLIAAYANAVEQFRVRGDGVIYAQNTTVQSISDARLKENVSTATDGLDVITALRPVRYDWKAGYGNDRKNQLGFIAQEVEAVFPEAVSEWSMDEPTGEVDEDGKPITEKVDYKTVGPGALIPVLVKAIQELEARIAALEA